MLITTIPVKTYATATTQIVDALAHTDVIECRLDYLPYLDLTAIAALRAVCTCPLMFTLRSMAHGGFYAKSSSERLKDLLALAALDPEYLDIEDDMAATDIAAIHNAYPRIKLLCSHHNVQTTPQNLLAQLQAMVRPEFYAYKIATMAQSSLDALRMLQFVQSWSNTHRITGLCMGEDGLATRILSPVVGNFMNYCCVSPEDAVAPGQITVRELLDRYHYRDLNRETKIYALLGDPVANSVGHIVHNQAMVCLSRNAVYLKLRISKPELSTALAMAKGLNIAGFSVTMPLKEVILPLLNKLSGDASSIQAVNTVVRDRDEWVGWNTDGEGAMRALSSHLDFTHQTLLILGAGGAARAIIFAALQRQARVIIVNRTLARAQALAKEFGCEAVAMTALRQCTPTVVINTLPESAYTAEWLDMLQPLLQAQVVVMDIVYEPRETLLLQRAKAAQCYCVYGYDMYLCQALLQIQHWFQPEARQLEHLKTQMCAPLNERSRSPNNLH